MVLQNCQTCTNYWVQCGRDLHGYRILTRNEHISRAHEGRIVSRPHIAHPKSFSESSSRQPMPDTLPRSFSEGSSSQPKPGGDENANPDSPRFVWESKMKQPMVEKDPSWYFPLYRAAMDGDWKKGKQLLDLHGEEALRAKISGRSETALHVAVGSGPRTIKFVQNWLDLLSDGDLEAENNVGCTALGIAAKVGNLEAARVLVEKHKKLLYIESAYDSFPIHSAAKYGYKEMLVYLLDVTKEGQRPDPYDPRESGPKLLRLIIQASFYDTALHLVKRMPELAVSGKDSTEDLSILAENPSAFSCLRSEGVFLPIIYACVPELPLKQPYRRITRDIENAASEANLSDQSHLYWQRYFVSGLQKLHLVLWGTFEKIAPVLKRIKSEKMKGRQARELVKCLCEEAAKILQNPADTILLIKLPLLRAAENGIQEIVKEITDSFPEAVWCHDYYDGDVFRLAIENRHIGVYNMLYDMGGTYINRVRHSVERVTRNNILHLTGYLPPSNRLMDVSGAALQMQRELQWFKEIESLVPPTYTSEINDNIKTPQEVFSESHKQLKADGENWMRHTANSCTAAAVLIATIAFAAAITVPGGIRTDNGRPILGSKKAFHIFGVADVVSLFTSCVSVLMFLSILTSGYAEGDFLRVLPTRLMIGLLSLFISVASMMTAYISILYLMFGHETSWIFYVIAPCCVLVAVFASMHISLLGEVIKNTYMCGIFRNRSKSKVSIWSHFSKKLD